MLQAADRVIRSNDDDGAVLLVDERFGQTSYLKLFPTHWREFLSIRDQESLETVLAAFWERNRDNGGNG